MTKRIMTLLIIFTVVICSSSLAEVDVKSLSTDELISMRLAIVQELIDRGEMKSAKVPAGEYIVGEDIPAGSYSITTDQILVTIVIGNYDGMYVVSPDSPVGKLTLKAGDKIQFTGGVVLTKYTGLSFE